MDRLVTYETSEGVFKECVCCDYSEKQVVQVAMTELDTRVNQSAVSDEAAQPVKIMLGKNENKTN